MKVDVKYLQPDPKTGILRYRRAFPLPLRAFVGPDGRPLSELKVSLGARSINEPGAKARHDAAAAQYDAMVHRARKMADGAFDVLEPHLIKYLAEHFLHCHLALDEASRWRQPAPDFAFDTRRDYENDYLECREMLAAYDAEGLVEHWRDWAVGYTRALGYLFDPSAPAFAALCRELGEASCKLWLALDQRIDNRHIRTPDAPSPPVASPNGSRSSSQSSAPVVTVNDNRSFETIALALIDNSRLGIKEGVKEHVRTALRFLRETLGGPTPAQLTRQEVGRFLDLMSQRPVKLSAAERKLTLPELAERYLGRAEVLRMSARTMEVRLSALSTVWKKGAEEGAIGEELVNPFVGRSVASSARPEKTAKGFSPDELRAYFSMPAFQARTRPTRGKGETIYWLPLLALYTGARPEEVAQLLVSDIFEREDDGRWVIRFTDEGTHPIKGAQTLKTERYETGRRVFPVPQALIELGLLDYRSHLHQQGEAALFPLLRLKSRRGGLYESFGGWFADHVYEQGVLQRGARRQPVREFRHTWTTAARASGIARDAREYIQGRTPDGRGTTDEDYGEKTALGDQIDRLQFKVDIVAMVPRWIP